MKKINQIEPWIDFKEALHVKKIVNKTFLTENLETKRFEENLKKNLKQKTALQSLIGLQASSCA